MLVRLRALIVAALMGLTLAPDAAQAQAYPSKPVTLIVAGGRPAASSTRSGACWRNASPKAWGRQVVVEHRPGANNQIAAEYVTKAPPDGHTLFLSPEVTFAVNPSLYKRLPYDPVNGFTPISGLVTINHALIFTSVGAGRERQGLHRARQEEGRRKSTTGPSASARPVT